MIPCPECGAEHYPGTMFCDMCGAAVHPAAQAHVAASRPETARTTLAAESAAVEPPVLTTRAETLPPHGEQSPVALRVHFPDSRRELTLRAAMINVGRADPDATGAPELDLTPYDGLERGVSRRHATIQWAGNGYVLIDRHSGNGTWLEGARLVAGYAYQLPPRATVRFGDLVVQLAVSEDTE